MPWCLSLLLKRENFRVPTRNKTVEIEGLTQCLKGLVAGPWRTVKEPCPDGSQAWETQAWNESDGTRGPKSYVPRAKAASRADAAWVGKPFLSVLSGPMLRPAGMAETRQNACRRDGPPVWRLPASPPF